MLVFRECFFTFFLSTHLQATVPSSFTAAKHSEEAQICLTFHGGLPEDVDDVDDVHLAG